MKNDYQPTILFLLFHVFTLNETVCKLNGFR
jgi:hypothetical protein